jgi:hypothetical protein
MMGKLSTDVRIAECTLRFGSQLGPHSSIKSEVVPVRNWREAGHPWYIVEQNPRLRRSVDGLRSKRQQVLEAEFP